MRNLSHSLALIWSLSMAIAAAADDDAPGVSRIISVEESNKLKAIRDEIGAIRNLDTLYEDRKHENGLPYHVYVPEHLKAGVEYPIVTFLHGYTDLTIDTHKGFPKGVWSLPEVQGTNPHILFVPRNRKKQDNWSSGEYRTMTIKALDDLIAELNADPETPNVDVDRLYLTGFSRGGQGTWNFIRTFPNKFAAAAPLSGFSHGPQNAKEAVPIKHVPIWIFNGDGDRGVRGSRISFGALVEAGADDVRYHEYLKQGHVIDDFAYFTDGFMEWMFSQERKTGSTKPNIVLFLADDLGWTGLSCFGSDLYETPNLDKLAETGMKFTDAYAACTVCSPSRAALMTGMYPARLRLTTFIPGQNRPFAKLKIPDWTMGLEKSYTTLAEALEAGGYRTIHIGKWHLSSPKELSDPTQHGFRSSLDKPSGSKGYFLSEKAMGEIGASSNFVTDYFADLAAEQVAQESDAPLFLYFAFHVPHTPIQGRKDLVKYFEDKVDPKATHKNPAYAAMVKSMDMAVGRVVEALEKAGKADDTLIIFTSDNGGLTQRNGKHDNFTENLPLRRGKGSAYEGGVRVPTIVKWPGITRPGSVCDEPVMGIDFYPTLLDITGISGDAEHNASMDGCSIRALLEEPDATLDRNLYWHFPHYHAGGDSPYSAIRAKDWRLVEFHEDGKLELYNLNDDLGEAEDLASSSPEIVGNLHANLKQWRKQVGAQMPTANPNFDPARQAETARKGKR